MSDEKISNIKPVNNISIKPLKFKLPEIYPFKFEINPKKEVNTKTKAEKLYDSWSTVVSGLSQEFFDNLVETSKRLQCNPEDLAAIMYNESRLNPSVISSDTKYHGLIQMTNQSLKNCIEHSKEKYGDKSPIKDISMKDYLKLSREKQLKYAEAYIDMLKDEQGMSGEKLTGGQMWAMIKSPKLSKDKTKEGINFRQKLQNIIDKTKKLAKPDDVPFYLKRC